MCFGQLCGIGDHMSAMCTLEGFGIFKYSPFGEKEIVFPFLMRRAQESRQMMQSVHLQSSLVNDELWKRVTGRGRI
jgi:hypothetical protein